MEKKEKKEREENKAGKRAVSMGNRISTIINIKDLKRDIAATLRLFVCV